LKIYNNNPGFGDCGPWDSEAPTFLIACSEFATEMQSNFEIWAREMYDDAIEKGVGIESRATYLCETVQGLRRKFIAGLTEV